MINLLSDQRKDDIRAARANVIILRYMAIIILGFLFVGGILFVSYSLLRATNQSNEAIISANDTKADIYKGTKQQVDALSGNLSEAKSMLNQEVRYSKILVQMGQLMPAGTVLGDITLDAASLNGAPVEIIAYAKSTGEATTLQSNFQSSPLFSQVNLKGTETGGNVANYPVTVTLSATLKRPGL